MTDDDAAVRLAQRGVYVGTCSWTSPTLVEGTAFYPPGADSAEERLRHYASVFPIVEVDSTYYGPPREHVAGLWVERTPDHFTFDVKAYRLLTGHPTPPKSLWKDVRGELPEAAAAKRNVYAKDLPDELLAEAFHRFNEALMPLHSAGKLGAVLFQFPPYFFPAPASYRFLEYVAAHVPDYTVAVEFRNDRWLDERRRERVLAFLEEHGFTYVCVDEPQGFRSSVPPVVAATSRVAEVRFHGRNAATWEAKGLTAEERFRYDYTDDELGEWVPRIGALAEEARSVHVLMNNCYADYGVRNGRTLAGLLAGGLGV